MKQPTETPAEPTPGEIQAAPCRDAQEPGLPVRRRGGVLAVRQVRITDDPEILEQLLAGLLKLS